MARPMVIAQIKPHVIEKIEYRSHWPVAMLADLLDCSKVTIYRYVKQGHLAQTNKGVDTESIVRLIRSQFVV